MLFLLKMVLNYMLLLLDLYYNIYIYICISFIECTKIIILDNHVCIIVNMNNALRVVNSGGNQLEIKIRVGCT